MTSLFALWVPILASSVLVFIVSSLVHMVLPWHKNDFQKLSNEDQVMDALRPLGIPPGDYFIPRPASRQDLSSPEFAEKMKRGPVVLFTIMPNGQMSMGRNLLQWFIYCTVVGIFAAYIASAALSPGAPYLKVFQFVGTTAFIGYSAALWQMSIWYRRALSLSIKATIDGLIYALLTAGVFGWLWPH